MNPRPGIPRLAFAGIAAALVAAMLAITILQALLPEQMRGVELAEVVFYLFSVAFVGVGLPLTLLHFRQRKYGMEPYFAFVSVGAIGFVVVEYVLMMRYPQAIQLEQVPAIALAVAVGGGAAGAMHRFALRAGWGRSSAMVAAVLAVSCGGYALAKLPAAGAGTRGLQGRSLPPAGPVVSSATDPKLRALGEAIQRLLELGDSETFAQETAATVADWDALLPTTTGVAVEHPLGDDPALDLRQHRRAVADSAAHLVEIARRSGIAADSVRFHVRSVTGRGGLTTSYDVAPGRQAVVRQLQDVRVFVSGEATGADAAAARLAGDYQINVGGVVGFPGGWRIQAGMRWVGFPVRVADEATRRELALLGKVAESYFDEKRMLAVADDPLLVKLGETFAALLRNRSVPEFVAAARSRREEQDTFARRFEWETPEETEQTFAKMSASVTTSAQAILGTLDRLGIDLSDAEITLKNATAERVMFGQWTFGSPNGLRSDAIRLTFGVRSTRKSRDGRPIAGDFVLTTGSAIRKSDRWVLWDAKSRWKELPAALMTRQERERIEFENHVIEEGSLPIGMAAPDIAWVRCDTGANARLSDYRGKVVVLEWWASWCGPCQPTMTELQKLVAAHPEWKDRVAVIAISIDDEKNTAVAHVAKRQWTKTDNVWAGPGEFGSAAARAFRLGGVPNLYVIDRAGKIMAVDHPAILPVAEMVQQALRK